MNKKSAFTMAELLITMAIIGIVVTFGVKASLQNDKGIRHIYSNTYHVLDTALYNAINFPRGNVGDPFADRDGARILVGRQNNGQNIPADEGTERLCLRLTEYINTVEPNPCQASAAIGSRPARAASRNRLISDQALDREFTDNMVQFTATNGVRYFFSRRMPFSDVPAPRTMRPEDADSTFFIIYADINGTKRPNSLEYSAAADVNHRNRSIDPDIFAFAAMKFGRVVPLGPPEFDGRFMLSRVSYYNIENSRNDDLVDVLYSKPSQPYYLTKAQAWGYYNSNSPFDDFAPIENNPYSYNDWIRRHLHPQSRIYSFVRQYFTGNDQTQRVVRLPAAANIKQNPVSSGGYNCSLHSDENCDVIVDKYVY